MIFSLEIVIVMSWDADCSHEWDIEVLLKPSPALLRQIWWGYFSYVSYAIFHAHFRTSWASTCLCFMGFRPSSGLDETPTMFCTYALLVNCIGLSEGCMPWLLSFSTQIFHSPFLFSLSNFLLTSSSSFPTSTSSNWRCMCFIYTSF